MKRTKQFIIELKTSSLARNAGWMLAGQGTSAVLQTAYFILLARILGAKEYGTFIGAFALVAIFMPFSALGAGLIYMRYAGANRDRFPEYWGNVIISIVVVGTLLTGLCCVLAPHILNPASASMILPVAIANCLCAQLVLSVGQIFQSSEQLKMTSLLNISVNFLRLSAVGVMALRDPHATARDWAMYSLAASFVAACFGVFLITSRFGMPRFSTRLLWTHSAEGFGFSFAGSTQSIYNDIDKTVLSHYGLNSQNGAYTLAYRVVDLATMPVAALDAAALPRFFRQSVEGIRSIRSLSNRILIRALLVSIVVSLSLFVCAPLLPLIAGPSFGTATSALIWLCPIVVFRAVHQLSGSAVTGLGYQRYRTAIQVFAAGGNLLLNVWLISSYGWIGAAWASLITDGALAIGNFTVLRNLKEPRATM